MNRPIYTFTLKKRNFKTHPFYIYFAVDGWPVGSVWSNLVRLRRTSNGLNEEGGGTRWMLKDKNHDIYIHADRLFFQKEQK